MRFGQVFFPQQHDPADVRRAVGLREEGRLGEVLRGHQALEALLHSPQQQPAVERDAERLLLRGRLRQPLHAFFVSWS